IRIGQRGGWRSTGSWTCALCGHGGGSNLPGRSLALHQFVDAHRVWPSVAWRVACTAFIVTPRSMSPVRTRDPTGQGADGGHGGDSNRPARRLAIHLFVDMCTVRTGRWFESASAEAGDPP